MDKPWERVFQTEVTALYEYLVGTGMRIDFQNFSTQFIRAFEEATSKSHLNHIEIPMQEIIVKVMRKFGVHNQDLVQGALEAYYKPELESSQLYPDSLQALTDLQKDGYPLGLISNAKSDWAVHAILRKFEIDRYFKIVLSSAALRIRKPRSAIFLNALNALNLPPSDTVFIGDSLDADVIGARNVGIHAIYLQRKSPENQILMETEATVNSLTQAVKTINDWTKD